VPHMRIVPLSAWDRMRAVAEGVCRQPQGFGAMPERQASWTRALLGVCEGAQGTAHGTRMPWLSRRRAGGIPRHLCRLLHTVGEAWCEGKKKGFGRISSRLLLDSRVVDLTTS
jgi:hypothetical protein